MHFNSTNSDLTNIIFVKSFLIPTNRHMKGSIMSKYNVYKEVLIKRHICAARYETTIIVARSRAVESTQTSR